jgi:hypothetical protein
MNEKVIFFLIIFLPSILLAQGLGPVGVNYYSDEGFDKRIDLVHKSLYEYRQLMDLFRQEIKNLTGFINPRLLKESDVIHLTISGKDLKKFMGVDWAIQYHGYSNWMMGLKGYPYYKNFEILSLELELLKLKDAPQKEIIERENELEKVLQQLEKFAQKYPSD